MSSELRSKKLRGSGGYVVASVTDEQQVKGNLGGPDLFLAPIGRLDDEKISKYFCNTCDKDFEGPPKIEFENPNEEVAENLILVEKGQYICSTCNMTIAEYRDFRKPDETQDIGSAKPIEPQATQPEAQPEPAAAAQPEPAAAAQPEPAAEAQPGVQPEPVAEAQPEPAAEAQPGVQPEPVAEAQPEPAATTQSSSSSIETIEERSVYDENANKVGVVRRIGIDSTQSMILVVTKNDGTDIHVPWSSVKKIGEIILLGESQPDAPSGKCAGCGFVNKDGAKFCEECGAKI